MAYLDCEAILLSICTFTSTSIGRLVGFVRACDARRVESFIMNSKLSYRMEKVMHNCAEYQQ
jgi:hypothetical protein